MTADPGYLEEAAALLRKAQAANDRRAEMEGVSRDPAFYRSLNEERLRIAEDWMRLEALRLGIAPDTNPAADAPSDSGSGQGSGVRGPHRDRS